MKNPLVSVLIPTYNSAEFLEEALASVRSQSYPLLEIIASDDGSTDDTMRILKEAAGRDQRMQVHQNPRNLGPAGNFRRCLELASGEFVKYLIPDDLLVPTAVERLLQPMLDDEKIVLSTSKRTIIDRNAVPVGRDVPATRAPFEHDVVLPGPRMGDLMLTTNRNLIGEPSTAMFRASAAEPHDAFTYHGLRFRVIADFSLWLLLCERGKVSYIVEPLSQFRTHPGQDQHSVKLVIRGSWEWARIVLRASSHGFLQRRGDLARALLLARIISGFGILQRVALGLQRHLQARSRR